MSKMNRAEPLSDAAAVDWAGLRVQRVEHPPGATIFNQGEPAHSVMYVSNGSVRL